MFKEVITIFLSTVVFHDELTPINISGLCVAIVGIGLYNWMKYHNYKAIEKRVLENGGNPGSLHPHTSRGEGDDEAEMEALQSSRTRREHDGGQFQLVGEEDFDSSDESDDEHRNVEAKRKTTRQNGSSLHYDAEEDLDGIERLPTNAETHPNTKAETRQMEEKVNHDPMLVDLEREEERLEAEMGNTSKRGSKTVESSNQDLLFDAEDVGIERSSRH